MLNMLINILQPTHPDDIKSWLVYAPERGKKIFRKYLETVVCIQAWWPNSDKESFYFLMDGMLVR